MNTSLRRAMFALCVGVLACIVIPSGPLLAQSNWQQQQQRQQDMQRQQQEQQRQQQQAQQRQQMQDQQRQQMQAQQRQQMQEQQRQQMQAQQRQQMQQQQRQQMKTQQQNQQRQTQQQQQQTQQRQQQQTAEQQRRQMQQQGKLGTVQPGTNKRTGMVISGGVAKMNRPLTPGEIQRGFTGRVTTDGRALIKFQGRIFTVPASRVSGLSAKLASQRQQQATRWTAQQKTVVNQRLKALTAANSNVPQRSSGSGFGSRGGSGCTPPESAKCQFNQAAHVPPALQARIDSAKLARQQRDSAARNIVDFHSFEAHGLKANRIISGSPEKVAVIGRTMGNEQAKGVRDYAQALREKGINAEIFDGKTISDGAIREFAQLTAGGRMLSNQELIKTLMYKENKEWAEKLKREGYTVIDIGNPSVEHEKITINVAPLKEKGFSLFYAAEKQTLFSGSK
jgi:hypothetical protein